MAWPTARSALRHKSLWGPWGRFFKIWRCEASSSAGERAPPALERAEELLREWVVEYPAILRPKLNGRRYTADRKRILDLDLKPLGAYWGRPRSPPSG